MNPIDFRGQRSKVKVTIDICGNKLVNLTKLLCASLSNLAHVSHSKRFDPIDFEGQRLKVKVTMDMYDNKLVNMIETRLLCASSSNSADMLTMMR